MTEAKAGARWFQGGHGRQVAGAMLCLILAAVMVTWAWKSVAVGVFDLPALGFVPALAIVAALMATGAAVAFAGRLAGPASSGS